MSKRIAVIGSGFGGLSAAIRLQRAGFQVKIFEKRDLPGGRAYVYHDNGFTFDAGPTVITAPECLTELFELCDKKIEDYVELLPVSPLYRLQWDDGYSFDYTQDMESTLAQIQKKSPEDAKNYPAFLAYTKEVYEAGYEKLAHVPFLDWGSMLRVAPQLLRLKAYRTVYGIVSKYLKDPHLREAFSFHSLLVGGNPFAASSIYTLIHYLERKGGVHFPKGGTHALVRAMVKLFTDMGGEIEYSAEIQEILTRHGEVTGILKKDGTKESFSLVVSNADVARTYLDLLKKESKLDGQRRKMLRKRYSMSLFLIYFGTKKKYPELAHHTVLFGPRYEGLLADIFDNGVLAQDFSLYLHAPTRTDPNLAPEGCEGFYVLSPVPHLGNASIDWKTVGPRYAETILTYLEKHAIPGLRENLITQRIFTPEDFKEELNAHLGSAFSLEPLLTQSAYFRTPNRDPKIKGLYFVGAGTHPGAGLPGVIGSAKATSSLVIGDHSPEEVQPTVTSPGDTASALEECRTMIQVGSKSFSLAAKLFAPSTRNAAFFLYGWCRYCDDQIDLTSDPVKQKARVLALEKSTLESFAGEGKEAVFIALQEIAKRYGIPSYYALELLQGMQMDANAQAYPDFKTLELYCYRVAGTVGLMMSHIMGVSDQRALKHAGDLGSAMQLTNIARDIMEDAKNGRVYLPETYLAAEGIQAKDVLLPKHRERVVKAVRKLLAEADLRYESGNEGLKFLSARCALAVGMASSVYRRIGKKVLAKGTKAWDHRVVVSRWGKIAALGEGAWLVLKTVPYRMRNRWRPTTHLLLWPNPATEGQA